MIDRSEMRRTEVQVDCRIIKALRDPVTCVSPKCRNLSRVLVAEKVIEYLIVCEDAGERKGIRRIRRSPKQLTSLP